MNGQTDGERRIARLEDLLQALLRRLANDEKTLGQAVQDIQQLGAGSQPSGSGLALVPAQLTAALASGSCGSPSTAGATRCDNSASITVTNYQTLCNSIPSGNVILTLTADGVTFVAA